MKRLRGNSCLLHSGKNKKARVTRAKGPMQGGRRNRIRKLKDSHVRDLCAIVSTLTYTGMKDLRMIPPNFLLNRLTLAGVWRAHFRGKSRRKGGSEGTVMIHCDVLDLSSEMLDAL